jgi:hypothetical protein
MNNGLLIRVAIDSTSGGWNGPCDDDGFCYVPMGSSHKLTENYDRAYHPYRRAVSAFLPDSAHHRTHWPRQLPSRGHFDPDFEHLSYGDAGRRAARIRSHLANGGFIVFYAGLRSVHSGELCYSIIGFYAIDGVLSGLSVRRADWHRNAHTRGGGCTDEGTIVVFGRRGESGRLRRHIPIGSYRSRAWRVRRDILREWGGLDVRDGYIQRSGHLPAFRDTTRFLRWFHRQRPEFISVNNPRSVRSERRTK